MLEALDRLSEFRALRLEDLDLSRVPPGRLRTLARYAALSKAQAIQRMPDERQIATLLAFARTYESVAQDDAVDLLHQFIGTKLLRAEHAGERERLRTLPDLDASALRLREMGLIVLDPLYADAELRAAIFARISREQLEKDVNRPRWEELSCSTFNPTTGISAGITETNRANRKFRTKTT
jgi:hypothetical protein